MTQTQLRPKHNTVQAYPTTSDKTILIRSSILERTPTPAPNPTLKFQRLINRRLHYRYRYPSPLRLPTSFPTPPQPIPSSPYPHSSLMPFPLPHGQFHSPFQTPGSEPRTTNV